uniref:(California timema) hypothetical protein n=1 Tax=Timema californicum TaxID=61474 RepID=A0A7R9P9B5_TIMCA|nr:unnamed protein product [Timema californicum]
MRSQGTRFPCTCCHCPKPLSPCVCSREKRVSSPEHTPQEAWFIPTPPRSTPHWKKDFLRLRRQWSIRSKVPSRSPPDDGRDFLPQTETKDHAGPCRSCPGDVRNMPRDEGKDARVYGSSPPRILNLQEGETISVTPTPRQTPIIPKSDMLSKPSSNTITSQKVADAPEDISLTFHNIDADRDVSKSIGRARKDSQPAHLEQVLTAPDPKSAPANSVVEYCHPIPQDPRINQELNPTPHCQHNIDLVEQDMPSPHGSPEACHTDQGSVITRPICSPTRHSSKDLMSSRLIIPSVHQSGFVLSPTPITPQTMYVTDPDRSPSTNRRQRAHPTTKHEDHNTSTGDAIQVDIGTSTPPTNSVTVNLQADVIVSFREEASLYSGNDMKAETIVTVDVSKESAQRSYSADRLVEITTTSGYTGPAFAHDDPRPTTRLTEDIRCRRCLQKLSTRETKTPSGAYCPERGMCWTCQCVPLSFDMNTQTDEVKLRSGDPVRTIRSICDDSMVRPQREESNGNDRILRRKLVDINGQKLKTVTSSSKISSLSRDLDQIFRYPLRKESIPSIVELSNSGYRSPRRTSSPSTIELSKEVHTTPPRRTSSPSANKPSNNGYKSRRASSPPVIEPSKKGYKTPPRRTISKNINKPFKEGYKTPPRRAGSPPIIEACKDGFNIVPRRTSSPPTIELSKEYSKNPPRKSISPKVTEQSKESHKTSPKRTSSPPTNELSKEGSTNQTRKASSPPDIETPPRRMSSPPTIELSKEGYKTSLRRESSPSVSKPFKKGYATPPRRESSPAAAKPFEKGYTTPPRRASSPPVINLPKQGYETPSRRESSPPVIDLSKEGINITSISPLALEITNTSYKASPKTKSSSPNIESPLEIFTTASSTQMIKHSDERLKKALIKNDIYEPEFLKRPHPHTGLRHHSFDLAAVRKNAFLKDNRDFRRGIQSLDTVPKVRLSINVEDADIPVGIMESIVDSLTLTSPSKEVEEVCTRTTVPLIEDIRVTKVENEVKAEVKSIRERQKKLNSTLGDTTRKLFKK